MWGVLSIWKRKVENRLQISFLILSEFTWVNELLLSLKSSENYSFSYDFRSYRSLIIHLIFLNVRYDFPRRSWTFLSLILSTTHAALHTKEKMKEANCTRSERKIPLNYSNNIVPSPLCPSRKSLPR